MAKVGRKRIFDRDKAVHDAMHLFWEYGYEATSISLLNAKIGGGITPPSFYAAFSSKENLFREVVDHYTATHGKTISSLWDEDVSPRQAIELALRRSAKMQTERTHPKGCLLVLSSHSCSPKHINVQRILTKRRICIGNGFQQCVQRAVNLGFLPSNTIVKAYSAGLYSFFLGFSMQARDGVKYSVLDNAITIAMSNWERADIS